MEQVNFNIATILLIVAAIQGFALAFMLISHQKYRKKSNIALSAALSFTSIILLHNVLFVSGAVNLYPKLIFVPMEYTILLGASIYYFIVFLTEPDFKFGKRDLLILLLALYQVCFSIGMFIISIVNYELISAKFSTVAFLYDFDEFFAIAISFILFLLAYQRINKYQDSLMNNYSEIEKNDLTWLRMTMKFIFILWFLWALSHVYLVQTDVKVSLYYLWFGMAAGIYCMGYMMYMHRDFFEVPQNIKKDSLEAPEHQLSEKTNDHYQRLLAIMEEDKVYLNPELSMSILAEKMELSNGYLSQIINQKEGKNFFEFVNGYRVNEVKLKMKDASFDHYSILAIGMESGFKSKSTFNSVFKKITGQTPSSFKKGVKN